MAVTRGVSCVFHAGMNADRRGLLLTPLFLFSPSVYAKKSKRRFASNLTASF